jgi:multiple sugar transport system substrate-binding protein
MVPHPVMLAFIFSELGFYAGQVQVRGNCSIKYLLLGGIILLIRNVRVSCATAIALICLFSLSVLAAAPPKITLDYYTWGSDLATIENEQYAFSHFAKLYPHIDVQVTAVGGSTIAFSEKIIVQHAAGIAPDMFTISGSASQTPLFFRTGMVLDLTGYAKRDGLNFDRYIPGSWAYTWWDGKLFAFPRTTKGTAYATGVLVYNRRLFDEGGLGYPRQGWTFDEYIATARRLTRSTSGGPQPDVWGTRFVANDWFRYLWSNGGELVNEAGTETLISSTQAIEALEWYAKWQNEFGVAGGSFTRQTAAMDFQSTTGFLRTAPVDLDWAFAEAPRGPRSERSYTKGGCNVVSISSQTKHPEEAWSALMFLISEENQKREVFELGVGTAILRSVAFDKRHVFRDGPPYDLTPILMQATKPQPQVPGWPEAQDAINAALAPVWRGEKSVRTAVDEILPTVNAILAANK